MAATKVRLNRRTWIGPWLALAVILTASVGCVVAPPPPPVADPSVQGPHAFAQLTVGSGYGFGAATITYPTDSSLGRRGGVAISPGFTETQSAVSWYGPRLASHGFVVITIDTIDPLNWPSARATQLRAALTYLTSQSAVADRVDADRLAVMGHSMGGGGSLAAAADDHALKAAIPLAAWHTTKDWSTLVTPTLIVACQNDTIAPVATHSLPFYESLTVPKGFLEIAGGSHSCTNSTNSTISTSVVSFLKHFVDGDPSFDGHLCPPPNATGPISRYLATCPY